ncbi:hypothetical protein [Tissierella pigra]|uniref:Uncharacterized protein n=1 Tax=Tissierella pigra TaxID=2607614 RepID=A0A6N7XM84_9FIRM|nr:hypothetical protein [Tissierella pigra]MSU01892.1 hypothetical protein [Tissierella pigra]
MCDCIEKTEQSFKEHLKKNDSKFKDIEDLDVGFENKAWLIDSGKMALTLPININWVHVTKTGRMMAKTKQQSFTMEYCPFCGEKQSKESVVNE